MTAAIMGYTCGQVGAAIAVAFILGVFFGSALAEYLHGDDDGEGF